MYFLLSFFSLTSFYLLIDIILRNKLYSSKVI